MKIVSSYNSPNTYFLFRFNKDGSCEERKFTISGRRIVANFELRKSERNYINRHFIKGRQGVHKIFRKLHNIDNDILDKLDYYLKELQKNKNNFVY